MPIRIMFAGGGTGGHVFPAIAIAGEVRKLDATAEIMFVGTKDKLEARVVPKLGYGFRTIWISGFQRRLQLRNILFPLKVIIGTMQALSLIKKFRPDVVVGTGGYVSGPVLRAAIMRRIPTIIQEQNSFPGVTTRMLATKADEVHVTFDRSLQFLKRKDNVFVTGNPTRSDLVSADKNEALRYFGFDPADRKKTLFVFGGSLGAHSINVAIHQNIELLLSRNLRLIWQTGEEDAPLARTLLEKYPGTSLWSKPFLDRMDYAYAMSDLVVCRAGATTIAELTRLGKPAILIPYPHAAANHQEENANALLAEGAADLLNDGNLSQGLVPKVTAMLDESLLAAMSTRIRRMGKPDAAKNIAERVIALAKNHNPANN